MVAAPSCPLPGSFPTLAPGVPTAPSHVALVGGVLSWTDNAHDEGGYLVCAGPGEFQRTVAANVTTFVRPPDWPPTCPDAEYADYRVYAFNDSGLSSPDGWSIVVECPVTPAEPGPAATDSPSRTATPAERLLPPAGEGSAGGTAGSAVTGLVLGFLLAAVVVAGALGAWRIRAQGR